MEEQEAYCKLVPCKSKGGLKILVKLGPLSRVALVVSVELGSGLRNTGIKRNVAIVAVLRKGLTIIGIISSVGHPFSIW